MILTEPPILLAALIAALSGCNDGSMSSELVHDTAATVSIESAESLLLTELNLSG